MSEHLQSTAYAGAMQTLEAPSVMEASNGARVDDDFAADTAPSDSADSSDEDGSVIAVESAAGKNRCATCD